MKLSPKDFKRFKELEAKVASGKATSAEKAEFENLSAKRNEKGSNNLEWWKNYPALTDNVTNLPFNWIPGRRLELTNNNPNEVETKVGSIAIAKYMPTIGHSESDADAFNTQIRQLWLDMHRKYRGIGKYEKSDLGMMILAVNSLFSTIAKFERIYGVINTYHVGNRVVPNGLKDALGIDIDLEMNLADFRYLLNLYIAKAKQLCLPKGLSILEADVTNLSNLFKDSANERAFIFGFDTTKFGVYASEFGDPNGTPQIGSCVKFCDFGQYMNGSTPSGDAAFMKTDIADILEKQVSLLLNDEDIAIMCSDLLAAYGPENVMTLSDLPEDYKVEPVHDYERLVQFHNLTIHGDVATVFEEVDNINATNVNYERTKGFDIIIYQYNNVIYNKLGRSGDLSSTALGGKIYPTFNASTAQMVAKLGEVVFDTWVDKPGATEIMCGTRFTNLANTPLLVATSKYQQAIDVLGTAVVERVVVYFYDSALAAYGKETFTGNVLTNAGFANSFDAICYLSHMDWRPTLYRVDNNNIHIFGDIDNFTMIDRTNLGRIHEVALLSGYKIPMVSYTDK